MNTIKFSIVILVTLLAISCKKTPMPNDSSSSNLDPLGSKDPDRELVESKNGKKNQYTPEQMTEISFEEENYDFGNIKKSQGKVHHYYKFTNTGDKPLLINVTPGCGCTVGEYTKEPIAPGATDSIKLEFNPKSFNGEIHKSASVDGNFNRVVTLKFEANVVG